MKRKIMFLVLLAAGMVFAQPPGELLPIFPAPLDDVLLPWPEVERVDDELCWPDNPAPFIGAAYTWHCYYVPLPWLHVTRGLTAGFKDAGYWSDGFPALPSASGGFTSREWGSIIGQPETKYEYHVFSHAESGTLFSIAAEF